MLFEELNKYDTLCKNTTWLFFKFYLYCQRSRILFHTRVLLAFLNDWKCSLQKTKKPKHKNTPDASTLNGSLSTLHRAFQLPLTFQPIAFYVLQRSAMKPYTCAIMTSESLGDEFTSAMWNSAHVWQGKSSVNESATQVGLLSVVMQFDKMLN